MQGKFRKHLSISIGHEIYLVSAKIVLIGLHTLMGWIYKRLHKKREYKVNEKISSHDGDNLQNIHCIYARYLRI